MTAPEHDGRTLDWRPRYDERSRGYAVAPADVDPPATGVLWKPGRTMDQGAEGACCGFAASAELAAEPVPVPRITNGYALGVYRRAQRAHDEWAGESYSGTSVLAVLKVLRERGYCTGFRWSFTVAQLATGLVAGADGADAGPAIIGVEWRTGSYETDAAGVLRPSGAVVGGHALCVLGYFPAGATFAPDAQLELEQLGLWNGLQSVLVADRERGAFVLLNSWGEGYGRGGLFVVPWSVMEAWCAAGWECAHPVGRKRPRKVGAGMADDVDQDVDDAPETEQPATAAEDGEDVGTQTLELPARDVLPGDRLFVSDQVQYALDRESVTVAGTQLVRVGTQQQVVVHARAGSFAVGADVLVKVRRTAAE